MFVYLNLVLQGDSMGSISQQLFKSMYGYFSSPSRIKLYALLYVYIALQAWCAWFFVLSSSIIPFT